jgi:O-antigen/teichoic acid export membrane protein
MLLDGVIVALERMQLMAAATLVEYAVKVGIAVVLLLLGFGLNAVLITAVVSRILGCIVAARLLERAGVRVGWSADRAVLSRLSRLAPTFLFTAVFASLYWRIDILMLSKLAPVADLGYYGAAYRLFEIAAVVPQSLCLSIYPQVATAIMSDKAQLGALGRNAMRYLMATSLPAAIFLTLLPHPVLGLLYGTQFDAAAPTLSALIWTLLPYSVVRYHAYVLVAANRQRVDLILNIAMSAVNIVFNLILIPLYSHFGAACATLLSLCMLCALQYQYLRRRLPGYAAWPSVPPVVLIATAVVGVCAWLLRGSSIWIAVALAPALYVIALLYGGFFTSTELRFLHIHGLVGRAGIPGARRP